jgi:hypothetical protein
MVDQNRGYGYLISYEYRDHNYNSFQNINRQILENRSIRLYVPSLIRIVDRATKLMVHRSRMIYRLFHHRFSRGSLLLQNQVRLQGTAKWFDYDRPSLRYLRITVRRIHSLIGSRHYLRCPRLLRPTCLAVGGHLWAQLLDQRQDQAIRLQHVVWDDKMSRSSSGPDRHLRVHPDGMVITGQPARARNTTRRLGVEDQKYTYIQSVVEVKCSICYMCCMVL